MGRAGQLIPSARLLSNLICGVIQRWRACACRHVTACPKPTHFPFQRPSDGPTVARSPNGWASDLQSEGRELDPRPRRGCVTTLGEQLFEPMCLDAHSLCCYYTESLN